MDRLTEFRRAFQRQIDTYRAGDFATYLKGYASDVTIFVGGAGMNLEQMRVYLESVFESGGKVLNLQIPVPDNVRFSESGDAATLSLTWRELFHHPDGHETDSEYHETDVWFRRNGEWKLVNLHLSTINERTIQPVKDQ